MNIKIHKYLTKQCSEAEQREMELWIAESLSNQHQIALQKKILDSVQIKRAKTDVNKAIASFRFKHNVDSHNKFSQKFGEKGMRVKPSFFLRVAAVLLILVSAGYFVINSISSSNAPMETITAQLESQQITLEDGSVITLRKGARLQYPKHFDSDARNVIFQGEAFFEIAKNPAKKFNIKLPNGAVEVLGTSFNINTVTSNNSTGIIVREGHVVFNINDKKIDLLKGDKVTYDPSLHLISPISKANVNDYAWFNKVLHFDGTRLGDVIQNLQNTYQISISTDQVCLNELRFTSHLLMEDKTVDEVLTILTSALNLKYTKSGDHFYQVTGKCD